MKKHTIVGVHLTDRVTEASKLQETLTKYGCSIKTRVGIHEVSEKLCSPSGIVIRALADDAPDTDNLIDELRRITGVDVQTMVFEHD